MTTDDRDDELDSEAAPDPEEEDLGEEDVEPDLDEEDLDVDDTAIDDALEVEELDTGSELTDQDDTEDVAEAPATTEAVEEDEDVVLELDDELHPDDVEEPLDVLLQERTASATLEDDEEETEDEEVDTDDRGDAPARIAPRRPGEFLCTSCFLVLPRNQLADEKRMLCRDCV